MNGRTINRDFSDILNDLNDDILNPILDGIEPQLAEWEEWYIKFIDPSAKIMLTDNDNA